MYDLPLHTQWPRLLVVLLSMAPSRSGGLGSSDASSAVIRNERGSGLLAARRAALGRIALDARGHSRQQPQPAPGFPQPQPGSDQANVVTTKEKAINMVTTSTQYILHNFDGMSFNSVMAVGTLSGNERCNGVHHCQFQTYDEARVFCNNNMMCNGILQEVPGAPIPAGGMANAAIPGANTSALQSMIADAGAPLSSQAAQPGCDGGLGCFYPAGGELQFDQGWLDSRGKTFERQVLAYSHFQDGRKLSDVFPAGERQCGGVHYCQFLDLAPALAFCDLDKECLGVMKLPVSVYGEGCKDGKGCYAPARGDLQHDPLYLGQLGETYLKQQEVAYILRPEDGKIYDGRFPTGTAGCKGVHNCQFLTLASAEAYCDANPTCKGILEHTPDPAGDLACNGGHGCFEPVKGKLKYDPMDLVVEAKLYIRQLVR